MQNWSLYAFSSPGITRETLATSPETPANQKTPFIWVRGPQSQRWDHHRWWATIWGSRPMIGAWLSMNTGSVKGLFGTLKAQPHPRPLCRRIAQALLLLSIGLFRSCLVWSKGQTPCRRLAIALNLLVRCGLNPQCASGACMAALTESVWPRENGGAGHILLLCRVMT